jgi:hypothetical protein
MTFEKKVTAAKFNPDEIEALLNVFELARIKIQDESRKIDTANTVSLVDSFRQKLASHCTLSVKQLFDVERLLQRTFEQADAERVGG